MGEPENDPESAEPGEAPATPDAAEQGPSGEQVPPEGVDEEELRRRIEEQLRKVRVQDLLLESVVSIANLTARRIAKEDEKDLEQARIGIEAMRAVVDLLEPEPGQQVRNAISELQVLYAKHARGGEEAPPGEGEAPGTPPEPEGPPKPRDSGLWTPPGTT
jgi:hypothetical protein